MRRFWRSEASKLPVEAEQLDDGALTPDAERLRWERDQALARAERLDRRRGRPALAALGAVLVTAALVAVAVVGLAVSRGSFAAGGAELDRQVATATAPAKDLAADAANQSGQALLQAGENLQAEGRRLQGGES